MTEARKERIKLRASYFNGIALSIIAVTGFGTVLAYFNRAGEPPSWLLLTTIMVPALAASIAMHALAAYTLRGLDRS
jgi:hypothetical protein